MDIQALFEKYNTISKTSENFLQRLTEEVDKVSPTPGNEDFWRLYQCLPKDPCLAISFKSAKGETFLHLLCQAEKLDTELCFLLVDYVKFNHFLQTVALKTISHENHMEFLTQENHDGHTPLELCLKRLTPAENDDRLIYFIAQLIDAIYSTNEINPNKLFKSGSSLVHLLVQKEQVSLLDFLQSKITETFSFDPNVVDAKGRTYDDVALETGNVDIFNNYFAASDYVTLLYATQPKYSAMQTILSSKVTLIEGAAPLKSFPIQPVVINAPYFESFWLDYKKLMVDNCVFVLPKELTQLYLESQKLDLIDRTNRTLANKSSLVLLVINNYIHFDQMLPILSAMPSNFKIVFVCPDSNLVAKLEENNSKTVGLDYIKVSRLSLNEAECDFVENKAPPSEFCPVELFEKERKVELQPPKFGTYFTEQNITIFKRNKQAVYNLDWINLGQQYEFLQDDPKKALRCYLRALPVAPDKKVWLLSKIFEQKLKIGTVPIIEEFNVLKAQQNSEEPDRAFLKVGAMYFHAASLLNPLDNELVVKEIDYIKAQLGLLNKDFEEALLDVALFEAYKKLGKLELARPHLDSASKVLQNSHLVEHKVMNYWNWAFFLSCFNDSQKLYKAIEHYLNAISRMKFCSKTWTLRPIGCCYIELAKLYLRLGNKKLALKNVNDAMEVFKNTPKEKFVADFLVDMFFYFPEHKQFKETAQKIYQSLNLPTDVKLRIATNAP
mgnify:CR=1 FL=1